MTNEELVKLKDFDNLLSKNHRYIEFISYQYGQEDSFIIKELQQVGAIGLYTAMNKYDPSREIPFIKYAIWWIKKEMMEYLNNNGRTIRIPSNIIRLIYKGEFIPSTNTISMNHIIGEDLTIEDLIQNEPLEERNPILDILPYYINKLPKMQQKVVRMKHYGIDGKTEMTFQEIGNHLGKTKQNIFIHYNKGIKELQKLIKF